MANHPVPTYIVQPFVGVAPVQFGMTRDEVRRVMPQEPTVFRKTPDSRHETDAFCANAFQVFYGGERPTVEYIELSSDPALRVTYRDLDVFATPAQEVIAYVSRASEFDLSDPEIPYSYVFRSLQLSLWRPTAPSADEPGEGRYFSTIGIGRKGYYDSA
jgi:hypothetical protein